MLRYYFFKPPALSWICQCVVHTCRITVLPQLATKSLVWKRLFLKLCPKFPATWASSLPIQVLANELQPFAFEWQLARGLPSVSQWGCRPGPMAKWSQQRECNDVHICDTVHNFHGPLLARVCYFQKYWLKSTQNYQRISLMAQKENKPIIMMTAKMKSPN